MADRLKLDFAMFYYEKKTCSPSAHSLTFIGDVENKIAILMVRREQSCVDLKMTEKIEIII